MTREEYYDALKTFDWYYEMSDSYDVYTRGKARLNALKAEANRDAEKKKMFSEFANYYYGSRTTKPAREEFDL